jgi:FKBP-type peptidyl-prolyl cis-trans isomerase
MTVSFFLTLLAASFVAPTQGTPEQPSGSTQSTPMNPRVKLETTLGDMVVELDGEKAPISSLNFMRYVNEKFYDGTIFHRVISRFMVQGGGYTPEMELKQEGLHEGIHNEWENGLTNAKYTISYARQGGAPDSATAQFFINVVDNPRLSQPQPDGAGYAVFGRVVEGFETVDKIRDTEVVESDKYPGGGRVVPTEPVMIKSARVVGSWEPSAIEARIKAMEEKGKAEMEERVRVYNEANEKGTASESGLKFLDLKVGEGDSPAATDSVRVHYTGWLTDGNKFDSSRDRGQPISFSLNGVIPGWTEGVGSMKVGGRRILVIPADLGYGPRGRPPVIPGGATLVFDVELLGINKQ